MDSNFHRNKDEENAYDGAIHQITPAPDHFVPQGSLDIHRSDEIIISRKPHRNRVLAF